MLLQGLRRSRDTGLLPATSADVAAGSVQATQRVSIGGTQLGRVADHQVLLHLVTERTAGCGCST
jgi:hypothetical protein